MMRALSAEQAGQLLDDIESHALRGQWQLSAGLLDVAIPAEYW